MNNLLFIITEPHVYSSLTNLINLSKSHSIPYTIFFMPPFKDGLKFRLLESNKYFKDVKSKLLSLNIDWNSDTTIIYSNSEGFILSNRKKWLPYHYNCREIMIQHGIMPLHKTNRIQRLITYPFYLISNTKLIGSGFGGNKCDYIIVYGQIYKEWLIKNHNWRPAQIMVSGKILKNLTPSKVENNNLNYDACLFLHQELSHYIPLSNLKKYYDIIFSWLSQNYDIVYIRKHPKAKINIEPWIKKYSNIYFVDGNLSDNVRVASCVFSFFSTALIDAFILGSKVIAISLPENRESSVYESFGCVIPVERFDLLKKNELVKFGKESIKNEYFDTSSVQEQEICKLIFRK